MTLLVRDLEVHYGGQSALHGVSLHVEPGEIVCLIGVNGAGKSTLMSAVAGLARPIVGSITLSGREMSNARAVGMVGAGLSLCPEGRRVFAPLTVAENLRMGAYVRTQPAEIKADLERVLIIFPRLRQRLHQVAGTLSGGEQQMLAIARALMSRPSYLLLDEPSLGLAPIVVEEIFRVFSELSLSGVGVLLAEQNARAALGVAHRCYLLDHGRMVLDGNVADFRNSTIVQNVYFGAAA